MKILACSIIISLLLLTACKENEQNFSAGPTQPNYNSNLTANFYALPIHFEANQDLMNNDIKYLSLNTDFDLFLTSTQAKFEFKDKQGQPCNLVMKFLGANANVNIEGINKLWGKSNYMLGNNPDDWKLNVDHFKKVRYSQIYPGIDLEFYESSSGKIEYDFIVDSRADPNNIRIGIDNSEKYSIDEQMNLEIVLGEDKITFQKPLIYQNTHQGREIIEGNFVINDYNQICFDTEEYNSDLPLIIDPQLIYSTFISTGQARAIAVDSKGNTYIATSTYNKYFPISDNAFQKELTSKRTYYSDYDITITKLNSGGTDIIYSTFLGGGVGNEEVFDIVIDDIGCVYATGITYSHDFPTISGSFNTTFNDGGDALTYEMSVCDAYVVKLDETGSSLLYSGLLGGGDIEYGFGIDLDNDNNAYVAGYTRSLDYPTTAGVYQDTSKAYYGGGAFLTKVKTDGSALLYSTYIGDSDNYCTDVKVDEYGQAFITGYGRINYSDYYSTPDIFVAKMNSSGSGLLFSNQVGFGHSYGLAIDQEGNSYITGNTNISWSSTEHPFPITSNAFQSVSGDLPDGPLYGDAFVTKLDPTGTTTLYSTFIGGQKRDVGHDVIVSDAGDVYIVGSTRSDDFPIKSGLTGNYAGENGFIAKIDPSENHDASLVYSSLIGGSSSDMYFYGPGEGYGAYEYPDLGEIERGGVVSMDASGNAYVLGTTSSVDFPITEGVFDTSHYDVTTGKVFLAKIGQSMNFYPHGIAYDPINWDKDIGELQSSYTGLYIKGKNFNDVESINFELNGGNDVYLEAKNIRVFDDSVAYDLIVAHSAEPGERGIKLKTKSGTEIDVTGSVERKFIVSKVRTYFNQAVDQNLVNTEYYREILVADKKGMVRLELDDEKQYGKTFTGKLKIDGIADESMSIHPFTYYDSYSEEEIINVKDYLLVPFPATPSEGQHTFTCTLIRDDQTVLFCPSIKRNFITSASINMLIARYQILYKSDGAQLANPVQSVSANDVMEATDYVKRVYPISDNQFHYLDVGNLVLPKQFGALIFNVGALTITTIHDTTETNLLRFLDRTMADINAINGDKNDFNVIVGIMPEYSLFKDLNDDGSLDNFTAGVTMNGTQAILVTPSQDGGPRPTGLGGTLAHELGHRIFDVAIETAPWLPFGNNLMDEYVGGQFNCEVNPPIAGNLDYTGNPACGNSPFENNLTGDSSAIFTDRSAYDLKSKKSMLTYIGEADTSIKFNFMGNAREDSNTWVSIRCYDEIMRSLLPNENINLYKPSVSEFIKISGTIMRNGTAYFNPLTVSSTGFPSPIISGPYAIEMQSSTGTQLARYNFDADFIKLSNPPYETEELMFSVLMEKPNDVKLVVLYKNDSVIASQSISNNSPNVTITNINTGQSIGEGITIEWNATDDDSDELTFSIMFKKENEEILPIVSNIKTNSYTLENLISKQSTGSLIVIATDGFNRGQDIVENVLLVNVNDSRQGSMQDNYYLDQNYPNPFNPETTIRFGLPIRSKVILTIYNILGKKVLTLLDNEEKEAGIHELTLSVQNIASGIYFINLKAGDFTDTKKIILLK